MPTITRTPRKDKAWAVTDFSADGGYAVGNGSTLSFDLLADFRSDLGITETQRVTVMRIIGEVWLGALGAASTAASDQLTCGFVWMTAGQRATSTAYPVPTANGVRQDRWIHQWQMAGKESTSTTEVGLPLVDNGSQLAVKRFDVRQMAKQPALDYRFQLQTKAIQGNWEAATVGLFGWIGIWLALS